MKMTQTYTLDKAPSIKATLPKGHYRAAFLGAKKIQIMITPLTAGGTEKCTLYPRKYSEDIPTNTGFACVLYDNATGKPCGELYSDCVGEA